MKGSAVKKAVIILVLAALVSAFFMFDLGDYLTLSYIKHSQAEFAQLYREYPAAVIGTYFLIYIAVTGLSLPGAAILTLLGGGLFGFRVGLVVVSFASSLGAVVACFAARYILRDWVQKKFKDRLAPINEGVEKEGAFYLFTLRLIPVFPFFVINLVMGLTPMRLFTFYWVSQVGMLAGTAVYVNAGKELAKIESAAGILSPGLIISFVILGLFPLAVKKAMSLYNRRKAGPIRDGEGREETDA